MDLSQVIEDIVADKGLDKQKVVDVVSDGVCSAYTSRFPGIEFKAVLDETTGKMQIFVQKEVVPNVSAEMNEISARKAKNINPNHAVGDKIWVSEPIDLGRVDVAVAKQVISDGVRKLEQDGVYQAYKNRVGNLVSGTVHKSERSGYTINLGDVIAFLPGSCAVFKDVLPSRASVRAVVKEVLPYTKTGYQIILDRSGPEFVKELLSIEIPEVLDGVVEVVKIERVAGYKTKIAVTSQAKNIDPVGSCVGVGGSRIKPIVSELGGEKIDFIRWTDDKVLLVQSALKPAVVSKVILVSEDCANVWVDEEQKAGAIGKSGFNVMLASRICGLNIKIHQEEEIKPEDLFGGESSRDSVDSEGLDEK